MPFYISLSAGISATPGETKPQERYKRHYEWRTEIRIKRVETGRNDTKRIENKYKKSIETPSFSRYFNAFSFGRDRRTSLPAGKAFPRLWQPFRLSFTSAPLQVPLPTIKEKGTDRFHDLFLFLWQGQKDLNPRPMVLETSTLPTELYPYARRLLYSKMSHLSSDFEKIGSKR